MTPEKIIFILKKYKLVITNEKMLQKEIAAIFHNLDIPFTREKVIGPKSHIDFLFDNGVGVEIKIKGNSRKIYDQCLRYAECADIQSMLLITTKTMGIPNVIKGKPFHILNLSRAWL